MLQKRLVAFRFTVPVENPESEESIRAEARSSSGEFLDVCHSWLKKPGRIS